MDAIEYDRCIEALEKHIAELEARVEPLQPFKQRILDLEARLNAVEAALRNVCHYAKPRYVSSREKAVRDGFIMSGALKHYEIMPHIIHQAQQALEQKDG